MIEIKNFLDCPEALPTIARWIHNEFWHDKPGHSPETMLARLREGRRDSLPIGLAAYENDQPLGTVSLIDFDMEDRTDLSPWLAALYVVPEARSKGIGGMLVKKCVQEAQCCGFSRLYLQTDIPAFYERLGWRKLSKGDRPMIVIMEKDIIRATDSE